MVELIVWQNLYHVHENKWPVDISDDVGLTDLIVMGGSVETIW